MTQPALARQTKWGRVYDIPGLGEVPSVTTVIKQQAAPALEKWKREQVAAAAVATRDWTEFDDETAIEMIMAASNGRTRRAAIRGTQVHEIIENGETPPDEFAGYVAAAEEHLAQIGEVFGAEMTLVNAQEGYAGTADLLYWLDDGETLGVLDWKTVGPGKRVGWSSHQLQLAALSQCPEGIDADGNMFDVPPVKELRVVGLREDGSSDMQYTRDWQRVRVVYEAFKGLLACYRYEREYPYLSLWEG